jgi:predicted DNA-binding transcriptional regulator AlpA
LFLLPYCSPKRNQRKGAKMAQATIHPLNQEGVTEQDQSDHYSTVVLRVGAVAKRYDVSTSTIQRWGSSPDSDFPTPIRLGGSSSVGFLVRELDEFDQRRIEERDQVAGAS